MRPISRPATLTALALATALTLTACGGDDSGSDPTPLAATSDSASDDATETDAETTEAEETEEPTSEPTELEVEYDVAPVEFGEPGAVTNPGTPLAKGEPAWLNQTATYGEEELTGPVGLSVLDVRALDASIFDQYSNAADFEGYTPYAITFQQQWFYDVPADYDPTTMDLFPLLEDGTDAEYLTGQFGFGAATNTCGLQLPEYDEETKTLVSCIIGLSKDQPVTTAMYNGERYTSIMASPDNAYFTQPLSWS
jgi:hypothetical protein